MDLVLSKFMNGSEVWPCGTRTEDLLTRRLPGRSAMPEQVSINRGQGSSAWPQILGDAGFVGYVAFLRARRISATSGPGSAGLRSVTISGCRSLPLADRSPPL